MITLSTMLQSYSRTLIKLSLLMPLLLTQISGALGASDVTALGDSLTAGLTNDGRGRITCLALNGITIPANAQRTCRGGGQANTGGWPPLLSTLIGATIYNFGNTDETTDEILARSIQNISAQDSDIVLILAGTNDVIRNVPRAQIISNLVSIINNVVAAGKRPIIGTIPPLIGSRFANRNNAVLALNEDIHSIENVDVADHYNALIENWPQHNSGDFIHLNASGNSIVAQVWAQTINAQPDIEPSIIAPIINLILED